MRISDWSSDVFSPDFLIRHPGSSPGSPRLLKCRSWHGIPAFAGMTKLGNILIPGNELLFLALGGSGEIGMNVNCYGCRGQWLMIDCGVTFADQIGRAAGRERGWQYG